MKKLLFLLPILALFACEQLSEDDLTSSIIPTKPTLTSTTRSAISANFDPLDQLVDIPVNVLNIGNTQNRYLSAQPSGNIVLLYNKDDGSLRQRWFIKRKRLILSGGNKDFNDLSQYPVIGKDRNNNARLMYDPFGEPYFGLFLYDIYGTSLYTISDGKSIMRSSNQSTNLHLQPTSSTSTNLILSSTRSDNANWEIQPVGEFKVIDIAYVQTTSSLIIRNDQRIDRAIINNDRDESITYHFSVNGSYNETSNFSTTEGVSVSITETVKVGIPIIKDIAGDITVSTTQTSSKSWTFGKSESKSKTIQHTVDVPIPGRSQTVLEAYMTSYDTSVTYVATLQNMSNNKTFKVKGTWSGITTTEFYCKVSDQNTNQILATYKFPLK